MAVPAYIEGIPTGRAFNSKRQELIKDYFDKLWARLQRKGTNNAVFNKFLQTYIYIKKNETDKKTTVPSSHDWKATYAIKHLEFVIANAKADDVNKIYTAVTSNTQKKNGYKQEANLYYDFVSEKPYMNFRVNLRIGVKIEKKHILYCVSAVYA